MWGLVQAVNVWQTHIQKKEGTDQVTQLSPDRATGSKCADHNHKEGFLGLMTEKSCNNFKQTLAKQTLAF